MATRAEILLSHIDDLKRIEEHIRFLTRGNETKLVATRSRIADSIAHIERPDR